MPASSRQTSRLGTPGRGEAEVSRLGVCFQWGNFPGGGWLGGEVGEDGEGELKEVARTSRRPRAMRVPLPGCLPWCMGWGRVTL